MEMTGLVLVCRVVQNRMFDEGLGVCKAFCQILYRAVIRPAGGWYVR